MPSNHPLTLYRLENIISCLTPAIAALDNLALFFGTPFLQAISNTTTSLISGVKTAKRNQGECTQFLEHICGILYAIIDLHIKSETSGELPLAVLNSIGKFMEILHKVHVFMEGQQDGNKFKQFFHQSEMNQILKEAQSGMQQVLDVFKVENTMVLSIKNMQQKVEEQHQELLEYIATLSDGTTSDGSSSIQTGSTSSWNSFQSSTSLSLLPSQPQIFHGRDTELQDVIDLLRHESPRIAILGAGGIGKTSLARAALHHPDVVVKYQSRFFIGAQAVTNIVELAALIGAHLGLKPGKDLTKPVISHLSKEPTSLLVLDNLETAWELLSTRGQVEELLSLLADIPHLALVITMRGAERPAKVLWTRPFLPPLSPLTHDAACQTFIDIADDFHKKEDIEKLLLLTDNIPLAVNLMAHLVDYEGCSDILVRWEVEKTSMLSDGYDKRFSLDASIELSLSSPRVSTGAKDLLSILSILPDGILDIELVQSKPPIQDILTSKSILLSTSLAYANVTGQLRAFVPIREFMLAHCPPSPSLIQPLRKYFYELLDFQHKYSGSMSSARTANGLTCNLMNVQNMLISDLHQDNPGLEEAIKATVELNRFRLLMGHNRIPLMDNIQTVLNHVNNPQLEFMVIKELFASWTYPISDPTALIAQAQKCLIHIMDPHCECTLYNIIGTYYINHQDIARAREFIDPAISLSKASGDAKLQCMSAVNLVVLKYQNGEFQEAQKYAHEAQKYARLSGNLYREAVALRFEALACTSLGDYASSLFLLHRARNLLRLCGMEGSSLDTMIGNSEAQIRLSKTEYAEARSFYAFRLNENLLEQDPYNHAFALSCVADIDTLIGASPKDVHLNLNKAKLIYSTMHLHDDMELCDITLAGLELREKNYTVAKTLFQNILKTAGKSNSIMASCLEILGDISHWESTDIGWTSVWAISFLGHALRSKRKLSIIKALQYLGDMFLAQGDEATAASLFIVALEGFTWMDIHRGRADCMLRLGNISFNQGDLNKAVESWTSARPLFVRSLQMKDISCIDLKLASVNDKIMKQHGPLARLAELTVPNTTLEKPSVGGADQGISSNEQSVLPSHAHKAHHIAD